MEKGTGRERDGKLSRFEIYMYQFPKTNVTIMCHKHPLFLKKSSFNSVVKMSQHTVCKAASSGEGQVGG